jgi:putative endonuclease
MKFYIYILYSPISDKYYVGFSEDPNRRLIEHNNPIHPKFTSKYIPWELKTYFFVSENKGEAMKIERYIKSMKSKIYTKNLITNTIEQLRICEFIKQRG